MLLRACLLFVYIVFKINFCDTENTVPFGSAFMAPGLFAFGYPATVSFDAPNAIICSLAEYEAVTPSTELQAYKNMNVSNHFY